ncbi:MAG: hypothetical protein AB7D38_02545 [Sulfurimonas sp.]|mgnify:CR=1 FL=1|uniref:hypothetical protein n=1 Tax=Sulfurimonas sp. TaxID=2022749 RepID=UPI0026D03AB1
MSKKPISKRELAMTIKITQSIEGYKEVKKEVVAEVMLLKEKHGIKVQKSS